MTFDILPNLPDDVLLEIFDLCVDEDFDEDFERSTKQMVEKWIRLAHVCRQWRNVVFQSPYRLNLRLLCTPETPVKDTLDIWPPLPLIIIASLRNGTSINNIIAALEHNDRVCDINLSSFSSSEWKYCINSEAMQRRFPELTHLRLLMEFDDDTDEGENEDEDEDGDGDEMESVLPYTFLGGTAPGLESLELWNVPFPGLPKLILSATYLVYLNLWDIPSSGYFPPEAMTTSLSALNSLELFRLYFRYPRPRPALESRRTPPPPLTRTILPSLAVISFKGASEYLEKMFARIDAPRLENLEITFFNQIIFNIPQLLSFISRRPTLTAPSPEKGHIAFGPKAISVRFSSQTSDFVGLKVKILCTPSDWQLSSLEQVCTTSLPPVSTLDDLYIFELSLSQLRWQDDVEDTLWLQLLHPFVAVKNLYLCKKFVLRIAPVLQELVGARTTEYLPSLEHIFLEGLKPSGTLEEGIKKFVAARQLTNRPVTVSHWDKDAKSDRFYEIDD